MNRAIQYLITLLIIVGIAYLAFRYVPQNAPIQSETATTTPVATTTANVQTKIITAENDTYKIEVHYPEFGIAPLDALIQKAVNTEVSSFEQYPANPPDSAAGKNELDGSFDNVYVGSDIASVSLSLSEYTGGAHGNTAITGISINRATGAELTLNDALALTGKTLQQVSDESLAQLKTKIPAEDIFTDGTLATTDNYGVFVVDKDNVTFIFNSYQVASYAAGPQEAVFPRVK